MTMLLFPILMGIEDACLIKRFFCVDDRQGENSSDRFGLCGFAIS